MYLLRLLRLPNLFVIGLTQCLLRYFIIMPAYKAEFSVTGIFPPHLSYIEFGLLLISTLFIAAGGYVINDARDINTDEINRPGSNVVGKKISVDKAFTLSYVLLIAGSIIGIVLSLLRHQLSVGILFPFSALSLYMYAFQYKGKPFGFLIIAFLSSLVLLTVLLFEPHFFYNVEIWMRGTESLDTWIAGRTIVMFYVVNAFLLTIVRELVKAAEDLDGDERSQKKSFAVRYGLKRCTQLSVLVLVVNIAVITLFLRHILYRNTSLHYITASIGFLIPYAALGYLILTAREKSDYHYASLFTKVLMLAGVLTMVPLYYYFM